MAHESRIELGYIGMISRNEQWRAELNAVPYMTTLNGQSFRTGIRERLSGPQHRRSPWDAAVLRIGHGRRVVSLLRRALRIARPLSRSKLRADILNTNVRRVWAALDRCARLDTRPNADQFRSQPKPPRTERGQRSFVELQCASSSR